MTTQERVATPRDARNLLGYMFCSVLLAVGFSWLATATAAAETRMSATYETTLDAPAIEVTSALDMRDDEYNSDYIFGMTKGVANSTMIAAIKPLFFLVTIPLDLAFLPLAAIGGFF